jgi:hypothetical protein
MNITSSGFRVSGFGALLCAGALVAGEAKLAVVDPATDPVMGEWGTGDTPTVQIVALGGDQWRAHVFTSLAERQAPVAVLLGKKQGEQVVFTAAKDGDTVKDGAWWPAPASSSGWSGTLAGAALTLKSDAGDQQLTKVVRASPTLGAKPPEGAVVLLGEGVDPATTFTGKSGFPWTALPGGAMQVKPKGGSVRSKQGFGSHRLHLEFRSPFMPAARGQKRGNSGVYIHACWEVQVLDAFGLQGAENETGGIYKVSRPRVNACLPPGTWQTYDIDFTAAVWDGAAMKTKPRITVRLNGIVIHENVELPDKTTGGGSPPPNGPGPLMLQDHNDLVEFRNIWALENK